MTRIFIPSLSRPQNVPKMKALAGHAELVWLIPEEQVYDYIAAGADFFSTGHPGQFEKINEALDRYGDEWCVFSDDDCRGLWMMDAIGEIREATMGEVADEFVRLGTERRDRYVGIAQASNRMHMSRSVTPWGHTTSWFFAVAPNTPERFCVEMGCDLDFAAQIADRYGRICRPNYVQGNYPMGGVDSHWREGHLRKGETFDRLIAKFPGLFKEHNGETIKYRHFPAMRVRSG